MSQDMTSAEAIAAHVKENALIDERAIIAEMLRDMETHFWYPMAKNDMTELRRRVGL